MHMPMHTHTHTHTHTQSTPHRSRPQPLLRPPLWPSGKKRHWQVNPPPLHRLTVSSVLPPTSPSSTWSRRWREVRRLCCRVCWSVTRKGRSWLGGRRSCWWKGKERVGGERAWSVWIGLFDCKEVDAYRERLGTVGMRDNYGERRRGDGWRGEEQGRDRGMEVRQSVWKQDWLLCSNVYLHV